MNEEQTLFGLIADIGSLDEAAMKAASERQAYLAKVPGSLGYLEDISIKIAGITGRATDNEVSKQCVAIMTRRMCWIRYWRRIILIQTLSSCR